ncbi:MAG: biotin--[acetyl-CoA-carboxylase] ligase [Burkholderiales bacterium]|uniref:biotin--[acetyl-CoA-carboxylase] ligase n=1 Tax=Nitrosomonas sp. TaxID=42353 RepID=UPI001DD5FB8A|nr:biotin--[acetyl-CoA-carboxylase] ligase [Nitrosomonas sp.]MCB1949695.1 biotin--[acetyl-CoA-carboxylase] ligase [Nitrosomonas sp.]MCP5242159.1 biotin--[acetyl-CoA-carboxylase] ligase [Burkholderiales bacterium]
MFKQHPVGYLLLLKILSDKKIYTYKSLSAELSCTTIALSKYISELTLQGIEISHVYGTAICWPRPFIWINEISINSYLYNISHHFNLIKFNLLDSTNSYLLRNKSFYLKQKRIPVIVTEWQTNGRGTRNRNWLSNLGGSLTFSFLWCFTPHVRNIHTLSLILGVGLVRVFRKLKLPNIYLKWPNDIIFNKRKFGGILTECSTNGHHSITAVIGVGINFKLASNLVESLDYPVADLFDITGQQVDRNRILALLLTELRNILSTFEKKGFGFFRDEWVSYHAYHGQTVILKFWDGSIFEGVVDGVLNNGSLVLSTASGQKVFSMGEISMKAKD